MTLSDAVEALRRIRTHYGAPHRLERRRLLKAASGCVIEDARLLLAYHELLLFAAAFPDDAKVLEMVKAELSRVGAAARALIRRGRKRDLKVLDDSGVAGSTSVVQLSLEGASWISRRFPRDTEIAWEGGSAGDGLDDMFATIIEPAEFDGASDVTMTTRQWFEAARGPVAQRTESDLQWLLDHFHRPPLPHRLRGRVFDLFELRIRWRLRRPLASRTFARMPSGAVRFQKQPLRRGVDAAAVIGDPVPWARPVRRKNAGRLIDLARAVLAVRHRETDPVTFADANDVTVFDMGEGISVLLFGQDAEHRLPLDTYYGYVLFKNRVPCAYGGGWMFFDRCEIGINVFDTFRGGESVHAFAHLLRLYHHHFEVRRFTVDPYQIGANNPEAIRSGAIWFYYRFGFRPQSTALARLAAREWSRVQDGSGYRSSPHILRRLAESSLQFETAAAGAASAFEPRALSLAVTRWIGNRFHGDRGAARSAAIERVSGVLDVGDRSRWRPGERQAFDDLALLVSPIPDLSDWPVEDQRSLVTLLRAKGGTRERRFTLLSNRHPRLRSAWAALARAGSKL